MNACASYDLTEADIDIQCDRGVVDGSCQIKLGGIIARLRNNIHGGVMSFTSGL